MSIPRYTKVGLCALTLTITLILFPAIVIAQPSLEVIGSYVVGNDIREIHIEDIDNDNLKEVIIASNDEVYVLNSDATLRWEYTVENIKSVLVSDVNNDGYKDILIASGREIANIERGNLHIIDRAGDLIFKYPTGIPHSKFIFYDIYSVDTNDNGYYEIICGFSTGVYSLKDTYDEFNWNFKTNETITRVIIKDIDGDGSGEIIAGSFSRIHILDLDGTPKGGYCITEGIKKVMVVDVSHTKGKEIVLISTGDEIHILNSNFEPYLKTKLISNIVEINYMDRDGDGLKEIILGTGNGIYMLNNRFDRIVSKYETGDEVVGIHVEDWDRDGEDEIVFGSGEYIYLITKDGNLKDKFSIDQFDIGQRIDGITIGDLDRDNYLDILINSRDKVYFLENRESKKREEAKESYMKAEGYFEKGRYFEKDRYDDVKKFRDEAIRHLDDAIRLYTEINDTINIGECESLKKEIELVIENITEQKRDDADFHYEKAEDYFLGQDYEGAISEIDDARQIYQEINDADGILRCDTLAIRINEIKENEENGNGGDILPNFDTGEGDINLFFYLSMLLLVAIMALLVSVIKRK